MAQQHGSHDSKVAHRLEPNPPPSSSFRQALQSCHPPGVFTGIVSGVEWRTKHRNKCPVVPSRRLKFLHGKLRDRVYPNTLLACKPCKLARVVQTKLFWSSRYHPGIPTSSIGRTLRKHQVRLNHLVGASTRVVFAYSIAEKRLRKNLRLLKHGRSD